MAPAAVTSRSTNPGFAASLGARIGPLFSRNARAMSEKNGIAMRTRRALGSGRLPLVAFPNAGVVFGHESLMLGVGWVGFAGSVGILLHLMERDGRDGICESRVEIRVLDPAIGVDKKVAGPAFR